MYFQYKTNKKLYFFPKKKKKKSAPSGLKRNLKKLYEFIVIPRFKSQLVLKKGYVNRMTTQIKVGGNQKFDDINRNNVNRGNVNRRITV